MMSQHSTAKIGQTQNGARDLKKHVLIDRLIEVAGQTAIAHHVPGRIRLKVKLSGLLLAQDLEAEDLMKYFTGILDARTNAAARSIVISYDTGLIAPHLWERLVNGKKDPSLRSSVKEQLGSFPGRNSNSAATNSFEPSFPFFRQWRRFLTGQPTVHNLLRKLPASP